MSKQIFCLDIGTNRVVLAEFQIGRGTPKLLDYSIVPLLIEPSDEDGRPEATVVAVEQAMDELGARDRDAVLMSVAPHNVLTRYVNFPEVAKEKLDQIVKYEAEENIPFPINEVEWSYQLQGERDDGEVDAVIVAIKQDLVGGLVEDVEAAGLEPGMVDVSTMAIVNAFQHNYPEQEGTTLIMDIGARTTDLIFLDEGKMWTRNVTVGGDEMTRNIAKELGISFLEAEELKKESAFVSFGGAYEQPDDEATRIVSKCVRNVMTRLHSEVMRTVNLYRGQQGGNAPTQIFLTGGASIIPHTDTFFKEKMSMDVEYLHSFANIELGKGLDDEEVSQDVMNLSEVVGLALRGNDQASMNVNLLPQIFVDEAGWQRKQPWLVAALFMVAFALAALGFGKAQQAAQYTKQAEKFKERSAGLSKLVNDNKELITVYGKVKKDYDTLLSVNKERSRWLLILAAVKECVAKEEGMWITSLNPVLSEADDMPALSRAGPTGNPSMYDESFGLLDSQSTAGASNLTELDGQVVTGITLQGIKFREPDQASEGTVYKWFDCLQDHELFGDTPPEEEVVSVRKLTETFRIKLYLTESIQL